MYVYAFQNVLGSSDGEDDPSAVAPPPPAHPATAKSWQDLLAWTPNYSSLAGVFRDIAELPCDDDGDDGGRAHVVGGAQEGCRLSPLGDTPMGGGADEMLMAMPNQLYI
jgi:hypothetical protein